MFCPRRDRLARPDQAVEGLLIEYQILQAGVSLVLLNRIVPPLRRGQRQDVGELVAALLDYHYSGEYRPDLAEKLSRAQLQLARAGFSMGGTPPYGFRRWLVREADHHPVRELADGERTKQAGHHVCWLSTDLARLAVVRRIVDRLGGGARAAEVARELTADRVPVPGRRPDGSAEWHPTTVRGLAVNPPPRAVVESGRRVEGTERRFTAAGPRPLADADYRADGRPKVVVNPPEARVAVPARGFEPVIDPARHAALVAELDARGASQRGKPRARAGAPNPLGGRVWDAGCTWPMYRHARGPTYRYTCSKYMQSNARECTHNWVDGPAATRFVLAAARQWLLSPAARAKLLAKLEGLAAAEVGFDATAREAEARRAALTAARQKMNRAETNLALAETEAQYKAVAAQFERLRADHDRLAAELEATPAPSANPEAEVAAALAALDRLPELGGDDDDDGVMARQLFE